MQVLIDQTYLACRKIRGTLAYPVRGVPIDAMPAFVAVHVVPEFLIRMDG